jgi:predicted short-subunit dehydrogenase-like oxidoreductase (DUF2520 family)
VSKGSKALPRVFIFGGGKVGSGLLRELRAAGYPVTLRQQRAGLPARRIEADLIVLALRDRDLALTAEELRRRALIGHRRVAIVHCAGALGAEVLAGARGPNVAVAQMHPMISFAHRRFTPTLERGQLLVDGDPAAMAVARAVGRRLGMTPRTIPGLDKIAYHAAAGLVANGAAALAAGGVALLGRAKVDPETAAAMLGPLLRSVAENVERLGLPEALTGPVRRGDAAGVGKHLKTLWRLAPELLPIYIAATQTQLPLARALGEAKEESFAAIEQVIKTLVEEQAERTRMH